MMQRDSRKQKRLGAYWLLYTLPVFASFGILSLTWSTLLTSIWIIATLYARRTWPESRLMKPRIEENRIGPVFLIAYAIGVGLSRTFYHIVAHEGWRTETTSVFLGGLIL